MVAFPIQGETHAFDVFPRKGGAMSVSAVLSYTADRLNELRDAATDLLVRRFRSQQMAAPDVARLVRAQSDNAIAAIEKVAATCVANLEDLAAAGIEADRIKRVFQSQHGIARDLKRPNILATLLLVVVGWVIETIFTAISLLSDGHVDLIPALGFAVTFSTVNVGLGLTAGFCFRYVGYHRRDPQQRPEYRTIRIAAVLAAFMLLLLEFLMIWAGARARVLGGHEGLFDFSEVGVTAIFNDGLALVIMIAAGLSFAISAFKAYGGFVDPIPGFGDHAGRAAMGIDDDAEDAAEAAQDAIDEIFEGAEDAILDLIEGVEDDLTLVEDVFAFDAAVENAKDQVRLFAKEDAERQCFVAGKPVPASALNTDAFDALKIAPESLTRLIPDRSVLDELRACHADATARIAAAHAAYLARVRSTPIPYHSL